MQNTENLSDSHSSDEKLKSCRTCGEMIKSVAKKCPHCNSFQDWRRIMNVSNTFLALLVALLTIFSVIRPIVRELTKDEKSDLIFSVKNFTFERVDKTDSAIMELEVLAVNRGELPGFVSNALIKVTFSDTLHLTFFLHPENRYSPVPAKNYSLLTLKYSGETTSIGRTHTGTDNFIGLKRVLPDVKITKTSIYDVQDMEVSSSVVYKSFKGELINVPLTKADDLIRGHINIFLISWSKTFR